MWFTTLIENSAPEGLEPEWGLSLWIEYRGGYYLLDAGGSDLFARNAERMGIDLACADAAVLSHAHYDHSGGFDAFCSLNDHAPVHIRASVGENCYSWHGRFPKYIGVQKGMIGKWSHRLRRSDRLELIADGVTLVPHSRQDMRRRGREAQMFVRRGLWMRYDDFSHEQSLVFETEEGLAIFSSCSHGGVDAILEEVMHAFPGKRICAMVGGFHLFRTSPQDVRALADRLESLGAPMLFTGHCTGDAAMEILQRRFPGRVHRLETGMRCEIGAGA